MPLTPPWPFGIGKVLKANDDGTIHFQWYRSHKDYQTTSPILPVWWDGSEGYRADKPRDDSHEPYTGSISNEDWSMEITQADLALHSFQLTKTNRLTKAILEECKKCSDIWWPDNPSKNDTTQHNAGAKPNTNADITDDMFNAQRETNARNLPAHEINVHTAINI